MGGTDGPDKGSHVPTGVHGEAGGGAVRELAFHFPSFIRGQ